jgi:hypothetical protein
MKLAGHIACRRDKGGSYWILVGNLKERDHLEDLGLDKLIILNWILKKWDEEAWTGLLWVRIGTDGGRF